MKKERFKFIKHIVLVFRHKFLVFKYALRCHLYKASLFHDISKFSLQELSQYKYYSGRRSPIGLERLEKGYSPAFLHHKRNKHHLEYWLDFDDNGYACIRMPYKYIVEMICDMLAATKVYMKKDFKLSGPLDYLNRHQQKYHLFLHSDSLNFLIEIFTLLSQNGIKKTLKPKLLKNCYQNNLNHPIVEKRNLTK